jgi:hypothetical protein
MPLRLGRLLNRLMSRVVRPACSAAGSSAEDGAMALRYCNGPEILIVRLFLLYGNIRLAPAVESFICVDPDEQKIFPRFDTESGNFTTLELRADALTRYLMRNFFYL